MKNKIIILFICILLCLLCFCIYLAINQNNQTEIIAKDNNDSLSTNQMKSVYTVAYNNEDYKNLPINYICPSYAYDTSTPEQAIGLADYAFIGKINKILRTEYRHPMQTVINGEIKTVASPYTIYEVNVIRNINGNLLTNENIEIAQKGGLEQDQLSYSFFEGMGLLNVGEYYILLGFTQPDGSILFDNPGFVVSLGDSTPDDIINKYIKAAQDPIVPEDRQKSKSKLYDIEYNK